MNREILELFSTEPKYLYYEHGYSQEDAGRVNTTGFLYRAYMKKRDILGKKAKLLKLTEVKKVKTGAGIVHNEVYSNYNTVNFTNRIYFRST